MQSTMMTAPLSLNHLLERAGKLFGGNQLAVFPEADGLDTRVMQSIAREFNLSETVFAFPPASQAHTRRLRIFTPSAELPFAGHPTVGAAFVLASIGEVPLGPDGASILFEEGVGPVPVSIRVQDGRLSYCELTVARLAVRGAADAVNVKTLGVLSEHRRARLSYALAYRVYRRARELGLAHANLCLIRDGNPSGKLDAGRGTILRRYTLYRLGRDPGG